MVRIQKLPRTTRFALAAAVALLLGLCLEWCLVFHVGFVQHVDATIYYGFHGLSGHPLITTLAAHIAALCNPDPYVILAAVPVAVALWRRGPLLGAAIVVILCGASLTTHLLKPMLAAARPDGLPFWQIGPGSWPSGHATASMALALCAVLAAPVRWRPLVAALGALFAVAVCYSFLTLGWHYPSDALAGLLVASLWTSLGIAGVTTIEALRSERSQRSAQPAVRVVLTPSAWAVGAVAALAAIGFLLRPETVEVYARGHMSFIAGAAAIGAAGLLLPAAVMIAIQDWPPARVRGRHRYSR